MALKALNNPAAIETTQEKTVIRSRTIIKTPNASKYLVQLAKHWSHKFAFSYTPEQAHIPFSSEIRLDMFADPAELAVQIDTPAEAEAIRMEQVFISHIKRFAFREPLEIRWQREP